MEGRILCWALRCGGLRLEDEEGGLGLGGLGLGYQMVIDDDDDDDDMLWMHMLVFLSTCGFSFFSCSEYRYCYFYNMKVRTVMLATFV